VKNSQSLELLTQFLIEEAILNSNEVGQLDASIAAVQRSLKSTRRERFVPVVGLVAEADYIFSRSGAGSEAIGLMGTPIEVEDRQWFVGISASLPLFRGGEIRHEAQQINIEITKLEKQKADLIQNIELNVRAKVLDLALSVSNLDLSEKSADFARQSYDMVQDAYSKGAVSIVELTDAQTNTLNAELAAINSVYEFHGNLLRTQRSISDFLVLKPSSEVMEFLLRYENFLSRHVEK
jgi:outer membrane protein TolC